MTDSTTKLQRVLQAAGQAPQIEAMAIWSIVRQLLLGLTDKEYQQLDDEIDSVLASKAGAKELRPEMAVAGITDAAAPPKVLARPNKWRAGTNRGKR